jgi:DHA2 family multidrug resistance protein
MVIFGISSLMNAFMSHDSSGPQMVVSLLVRSMGQPLIMIPLSTLATAGIEQAQAGSASALFNMMRNLGGSVGIAMLSTFVTQREQFHSVRVGESIYQGSAAVQDRINAMTFYFTSRGADLHTAQSQALTFIDNIVRRESFMMAYNDAFLLMGSTLLCVCLAVLLLKKPQGGSAAEAH